MTTVLSGPIVVLGRDTVDGRRVDDLSWRDLPLVLSASPSLKGSVEGADGGAVGLVTGVWVEGSTVMARAVMGGVVPPGTRFGVGGDFAAGDGGVEYVPVGAGPGVADLDDEALLVVFRRPELLGVTLFPAGEGAWPGGTWLEVGS